MKEKSDKYKIFELLPIILTLLIVPLIVFMKDIKIYEDYYRIWNPRNEFLDFFSYYKMLWLLMFSSIAFIMFILRIIRVGMEEKKKNIYYAGLVFYSILVMISTCFSKFQEVAFYGFLDRSEGMVTILAYSFMCFYTLYMVESYDDIKKVIYGLFGSALVICTIGIFQYVGMDLFKSEWGKKLILPAEYGHLSKSLEFKFQNYVIYSTLFHYNYVGSYVSMIFPLFLVLSIFEANNKRRLIYIGLSTLAGTVWLACGARSGLVGGAVALFALAILFKNSWYKKIPIKIGIMAIVVIVIMGVFARNVLIIKLNNTINEFKNASASKDNLPVKDLKINDDEIQVVSRENPIKITIDKDYNLNFFDLLGNKLPFIRGEKNTNGTEIISINNNGYKAYNISIVDYNDSQVLIVKKDKIVLYFLLSNSKFTLVNASGLPMTYEHVESWGFNNMEKLASARGYIWSRTIPLLKHTIFWGNGPDTFVFFFPQTDFIGKLTAYDDMWINVDKPHSFYLQQAVNNGVLALIVLLIIFITYIIQSWNIYSGCDTKIRLNIFGVACFTGVLGFLVTSFFNDSIVSVSPIFWIILGLGIATNRIVTETVSQQTKDKLSTKM